MRSIALLPHAEPIADDSNAERECTIPTFGLRCTEPLFASHVDSARLCRQAALHCENVSLLQAALYCVNEVRARKEPGQRTRFEVVRQRSTP